MWGDTWTEAQIESSGFGVAIAVRDGFFGINNSYGHAKIDHVRITVYYLADAVGTDDPGLPELLGAEASSTARIAVCADYFEPDEAPATDADGSTPQLTLIPREFDTGNGTKNAVRALWADYILEDANLADSPTMQIEVSDGVTGFMALADDGPLSDGLERQRHTVNRHLRRIRARFTTTGKASKAVIRSVEFTVRPSRALRRR